MSERGSFYRKVSYMVVLAVLLFPISQFGAPSSLEDEGGKLALLRSEHDLGQANLGEIDPASETMRLATLGMRGIAVALMTRKANEYKMKEDWTNYRATLRQLSKLQPYFITFWRFQAWNLTYNVSVELDAVKDRYYYVKRGIEFLKEGIKYNRDSPYLLAELGWFIGNKIGRADEHEQYRKLFKADEDYHPADRPLQERDNWLVSKQWYNLAVAAVDDKGESLGNKNPTVFYASPAMAQINYSEAIEKEGTFGDYAKSAWADAAQMWDDYGNREMKSSRGFLIRLVDLQRWLDESEQLQSELEELVPGTVEKLLAERTDRLTPDQRTAWEVPAGLRTDEQRELAAAAQLELLIEPQHIATAIAESSPDLAAKARKLSSRIVDNRSRIAMIISNRGVANYEYWETRCEYEQTAEVLKARELASAARRAFRDDADLMEAKRLYQLSFDLWAEVLTKFPGLPDDTTTGSDLMETIDQYTKVLEQLDQSLSDPEVGDTFPLWEIIEVNDSERKYDDVLLERKSRLDSQKP